MDPKPKRKDNQARSLPAHVGMSLTLAANPFVIERPSDKVSHSRDASRGADNMYGAFSIQTFCDQGSLSHTHDDASGFLDYVKKFNPPNFWYKDANVEDWAYYPQYDDWQGTYGMDAVRAVYHSGHGGMDAHGVFFAPMGGNWNNTGCTAYSDQMQLGDDVVRYIFWSTCTSLRVFDGQSPIKTWSSANKGWRMIFGFETTSIDSGDYGKFFFEEWNKGKSFSTAWMDAKHSVLNNCA
jgi:Family of unknown function (DUF6345)